MSSPHPQTTVSGSLPKDRPARASRLRYGLRMLVGLLLLLACMAWAVRTIDLRSFGGAVLHAKIPLLVWSGLLVICCCMPACSLRLWLLLLPLAESRKNVSFRDLTSIVIVSSAAHHVLPSPGGEIARTVYLNRRHGYSFGALVAAQLAEMVIDGLGMGLALLVLYPTAGLPDALRRSLLIAGLLGVAGVLGFLALAWTWGRSHSESEPTPRSWFSLGMDFLRRMAASMNRLRYPRLWLGALACSIVNDVANVATFGLVAMSVGVHLSVGCWLVLMLVARLAGVMPSTPGQFGVMEAGLVVTLVQLGVDRPRALAVAILYHLTHLIPVMLVGLLEFRRLIRYDRAILHALKSDALSADLTPSFKD